MDEQEGAEAVHRTAVPRSTATIRIGCLPCASRSRNCWTAQASVLRQRRSRILPGPAGRPGGGPGGGHPRQGAQPLPRGERRLLRLLRVRERPGGGRRPAAAGAPVGLRPRRQVLARSGESVHQLRMRHAGRRLRFRPHGHDDLQPALLPGPDGAGRACARPRICTPTSATPTPST